MKFRSVTTTVTLHTFYALVFKWQNYIFFAFFRFLFYFPFICLPVSFISLNVVHCRLTHHALQTIRDCPMHFGINVIFDEKKCEKNHLRQRWWQDAEKFGNWIECSNIRMLVFSVFHGSAWTLSKGNWKGA